MKKILALILTCVIAFSFVSCSSGGGSATKMAKILNATEYTVYMNIFSNGNADKYTNKTYTKDGILAVIYDSFNSTTRYYVWGYSDETLCCDWQWEFVPENPDELPAIGSHVKVTGDLVASGKALDGYWMEKAKVETRSEYKAAIGKFDTTTMSPTLVRVQLINMMNFPIRHENETIKIYGRVMSGNKIQHPYYDNAWSITLDTDSKLPAIGTYVTVTGKFAGTSASNSKIVVEDLRIE